MINDIISSIDWNYEFENLDVDSQVSTLENFLLNSISCFIPAVTTNDRSIHPWSDKTLRSLINRKKKAYNRLRKWPTPANLAAFKATRNAAVQGIRHARRLYEANVIHQSKKQPKILFSYINRSKKTVSANCVKSPNGETLLDDTDIAQTFNTFFVSTMKPGSLPSPSPGNHPGPVNFTTEDVKNALLDLKDDKSPGPDNIPSISLKIVPHP